MDQLLTGIVAERLAADSSIENGVADLVLGALAGDAELAAVLRGGDDLRPRPSVTSGNDAAEPAGAYLASVTVEGFRGIGPPIRLDISPGPGLTLVVGRNGSGKSSLAEGLEVLLTGDSRRWVGRSQVWKEGWRNLHHPGGVRINAEFVEQDQPAPTNVSRAWTSADALDDGHASVQRDVDAVAGLAALGWTTALDAYRPFLSYNELGSMLDEAPSKLYDAMAGILGLEDLVLAERRLGEERRSHEKAAKELSAVLGVLLARLREIDDDRARECVDALSGKSSDLDTAERVVAGAASTLKPGDLDALRQLATLEAPDRTAVKEVVAQVRDAATAAATLEGTDADHARRTADILEAATTFHDRHGDGDCPVCGQTAALGSKWHADAAAQIDRLRAVAEEAEVAHAALASAMAAAVELCSRPPAVLDGAADVAVDATAVTKAWQELADLASSGHDPDSLPAAIERVAPQVGSAVDDLRAAAQAELERREDTWRPLALEVAAWLDAARTLGDDTAALPRLRKAERWLKDANQQLRRERFAPIAEEAARLWTLLRVESSVDLGGVELAGSATQRKVVLDVTVDGADGAALGVMSQGELHSLALSLFLPRATLPESPFRFLVIDDPVQSMDPARVDGLARVLEETAARRQVVVFTHDDRLPESVRRLGIDATVWEVSRRENSVVELRPCSDPVSRHLEDAYALARAAGALPARIAPHVVPGFCRSALEAACAEAVKRRRLAHGDRHADVEAVLAKITSTAEWAALALFDDETRAGDVVERIANLGPRAAETFHACASPADEAYAGDLLDLVRDARFLAERLRGMASGGAVGLATVLFTDIVSSAETAASLGDRRWRALLDEHLRLTGEQVTRHQGVLVKDTGDGVLATFDSPARATRAALSIREAMGVLGLQIRAGLHTGEIEQRGGDIAGLAVVIARRICDHAEPGRILVSRTITDLVVGAGLAFATCGAHELKGVPGEWSLFEVADDYESPT